MHPDESMTTTRSSAACLALVVPCYNEQDVLQHTISVLLAKLESLCSNRNCAADSYIVLVDDGSTDATWDLIHQAALSNPCRVRGIRLAANAGHQNALMAGLEYVASRADCSISIDADLQDDLAAIDDMLAVHKEGAEIVLGVRNSRKMDTAFKRITAGLFYRTMRYLGADLVEQHADFRLLSRAAMQNLCRFSENHLFLRGLQKRLHNRVAHVKYDRLPRQAGESKYSFVKMVSLAWNGITSLSAVPLRLIAMMGVLIFAASSGLALYAIIEALAGATVPGWASITVPLYMLGGVILLSLAVVGEYVGKIYIEVKHRPRYLIDYVEDAVSDGRSTG